MRFLTLFMAAAVLSGCAQQATRPSTAVVGPDPICYSDRQCDAMWAEAMVQVQSLSGMRIQTATDSFVQTFNPTDFGRLGGVARRIPKPDGSTVIKGEFFCNFCGDLTKNALAVFNRSVSDSGAAFGSTQAAPAAASSSSPSPSKAQWREQQLQQLKQETGLSYEEYMRRYKVIMEQ